MFFRRRKNNKDKKNWSNNLFRKKVSKSEGIKKIEKIYFNEEEKKVPKSEGIKKIEKIYFNEEEFYNFIMKDFIAHRSFLLKDFFLNPRKHSVEEIKEQVDGFLKIAFSKLKNIDKSIIDAAEGIESKEFKRLYLDFKNRMNILLEHFKDEASFVLGEFKDVKMFEESGEEEEMIKALNLFVQVHRVVMLRLQKPVAFFESVEKIFRYLKIEKEIKYKMSSLEKFNFLYREFGFFIVNTFPKERSDVVLKLSNNPSKYSEKEAYLMIFDFFFEASDKLNEIEDVFLKAVEEVKGKNNEKLKKAYADFKKKKESFLFLLREEASFIFEGFKKVKNNESEDMGSIEEYLGSIKEYLGSIEEYWDKNIDPLINSFTTLNEICEKKYKLLKTMR